MASNLRSKGSASGLSSGNSSEYSSDDIGGVKQKQIIEAKFYKIYD